MLGSQRTGVIQLDRRGRVAAANDAALELLRREDGLSDGDGFLRAVVPAEDAELSRLLAQALPCAGGVGASGSMLVSRPRTRTRLELHVSPADPGRPEERSSRMGTLALVVDPTRRGAIHVGRVAAILGLTPAEPAWMGRQQPRSGRRAALLQVVPGPTPARTSSSFLVLRDPGSMARPVADAKGEASPGVEEARE